MKNTLTLVFFLIFFSSFWAQSQKLKSYTSILRHTDLNAYLNDSTDATFSISPTGIFLNNGSFDPIRITTLGIACYEAYLESDDAKYERHVQNQLLYFRDDANLNQAFDGKGIGLPCNIDVGESPRYSGTVQGLALSFLLRNRELNSDTSLDQTIHKIAYFMAQPAEFGGTTSSFKDAPWIEEYPVSEGSKHTLSGSIHGFIGLYEYAQVFPGNTALENLLQRLKDVYFDRLPLFISGGEIYSDLSGNVCDQTDAEQQVFTLLHMFEVLGNDIFRRQALLTAALIDEKEYAPKSNTYFNTQLTISKEVAPGPGGWLVTQFDSIARPVTKEEFVFDDQYALHDYLGLPTDSIKVVKSEESRYVVLELNDFKRFQYLQTAFESRTNELFISLHEVEGDRLKDITTVSHQLSNQFWHGQIVSDSPEKKRRQLIFKFTGKGSRTVKQLETTLIDTAELSLPMFGHYQTLSIPMEAGKTYQFTLDNFQVKYLRVFYKGAASLSQLDQADYSSNIIMETSKFKPTKTGVYQFLICYERDNLISIVDMLRYIVLP